MITTYSIPSGSEMGGLAKRGAAWTFGMIVSRQIISIGSAALLARMLLPGDYGLMALVATLTALLQSFSEMGLSWATIQRQSISEAQVHNLFWINGLVGLALWAVCIGLSPMLSRFYSEGRIESISLVLGASFAISGFAVQPTALIKRQMKFGVLSRIVIVATFLGAVTAVVVAALGFGYWALVAQMLVVQAARLGMVFSVSGYRPGRPTLGSETLGLLQFGGYMAVTGIFVYCARNFDNILIGRFEDTSDLGYYSRAYFLMMLPTVLATSSLTGVMVPYLSRLAHNPNQMANAYRRALALTALIGFPLSIGLAVTSSEAVRLVYGSSWAPVVPLLLGLSIMSIVQPIHDTSAWLFIAGGRGKAYFYWSAVSSTVMVLGFLIGINWGVRGVAFSASIAAGIVVVPALFVSHRVVQLPLKPTLLVLLPPLIGSSAMGMTVIVASYLLGRSGVGPFPSAAFEILVGAVVYFAAIYMLKQDRRFADLVPDPSQLFRRSVR